MQSALDHLRPDTESLQDHPEPAEHPVPLVIDFSEGCWPVTAFSEETLAPSELQNFPLAGTTPREQ